MRKKALNRVAADTWPNWVYLEDRLEQDFKRSCAVCHSKSPDPPDGREVKFSDAQVGAPSDSIYNPFVCPMWCKIGACKRLIAEAAKT